MNSGWDNELLNLELDGLGDFDMDEFGFSLDDLEEPTQTITGGGEVSLDDYSDDKFSCTCPQCGFKFNPKG
jgi:hypothetical protein